mmetsp:Transcript_21970/g.54375  ORF Transcript_21970/g.54375 Transcript_21970/m.54375 type:complete len:314 (+) Transcript_21970:2134-3075(+)
MRSRSSDMACFKTCSTNSGGDAIRIGSFCSLLLSAPSGPGNARLTLKNCGGGMLVSSSEFSWSHCSSFSSSARSGESSSSFWRRSRAWMAIMCGNKFPACGVAIAPTIPGCPLWSCVRVRKMLNRCDPSGSFWPEAFWCWLENPKKGLEPPISEWLSFRNSCTSSISSFGSEDVVASIPFPRVTRWILSFEAHSCISSSIADFDLSRLVEVFVRMKIRRGRGLSDSFKDGESLPLRRSFFHSFSHDDMSSQLITARSSYGSSRPSSKSRFMHAEMDPEFSPSVSFPSLAKDNSDRMSAAGFMAPSDNPEFISW